MQECVENGFQARAVHFRGICKVSQSDNFHSEKGESGDTRFNR